MYTFRQQHDHLVTLQLVADDKYNVATTLSLSPPLDGDGGMISVLLRGVIKRRSTMGGALSRNIFGSPESELHDSSNGDGFNPQKLIPNYNNGSQRLIPSLPDEIFLQILARVPRISYLPLKLVSRAWKAALTSHELFDIRKEFGKTEEWLYVLTKDKNDILLWYALDPLASIWQRLPPVSSHCFPDKSRKGLARLQMWDMADFSVPISDAIMAWIGRKDVNDKKQLCGCSVGAVDGCLYVLGGFSKASAINRVLRYDPVLNAWTETSPMSIGRAYSKTGVLNNKLYIVGGVSTNNGGLIPLQSAEVFDPQTGIWSQIPDMPLTKAQVLPTTFLASLLKPIATGLTSFGGKLFVPQSLHCWPFFVDIGGEVYDPALNSWVEMPIGMGEGWPAKQAETKSSITIDGKLYALGPSKYLDSAKVMVYDYESDCWKVVVEDVPIQGFSDSESPYLLAGANGKLHVITNDASNNITIIQVDVKKDASSFPPDSSSWLFVQSRELIETSIESGADDARVIAIKTVGPVELVSFQTLVA